MMEEEPASSSKRGRFQEQSMGSSCSGGEEGERMTRSRISLLARGAGESASSTPVLSFVGLFSFLRVMVLRITKI